MKIKQILIAAFAIAAFKASAVTTVLINGPAYTNATVLLASGTNGAGGFTYTTNQNGVVPPTATNYYNMPTISSLGNGTAISQTQFNPTNWPSLGFSLTGYPNTLYGPAANLGLLTTVNLTATNSISTAITLHYAGSDGYIWFSNYIVQTITIPVNTLTVTAWLPTNTFALPFAALQQVDNPGAAAVTNLYSSESEKPGL